MGGHKLSLDRLSQPNDPPLLEAESTHTHPRFNGVILSIAQIIKFVMALAPESELAALFITAREIVPHLQTLINMGWPQPKSPIQNDNSTSVISGGYQ